MIETKIYCDHCRKVLDTMTDYTDITIELAHKTINADLCTDCFEKLDDIINEFFKKGASDEKVSSTEKVELTAKAEYLGFSRHDCESKYRCSACGKNFGDWSINMQDPRCPNCKTKLEGVRG